MLYTDDTDTVSSDNDRFMTGRIT